MALYRNIPGIYFVSHGELADPELHVEIGEDTYCVNYWTVEDEIQMHIDFCRNEYGPDYETLTDDEIACQLSDLIEELAVNYGERMEEEE